MVKIIVKSKDYRLIYEKPNPIPQIDEFGERIYVERDATVTLYDEPKKDPDRISKKITSASSWRTKNLESLIEQVNLPNQILNELKTHGLVR